MGRQRPEVVFAGVEDERHGPGAFGPIGGSRGRRYCAAYTLPMGRRVGLRRQELLRRSGGDEPPVRPSDGGPTPTRLNRAPVAWSVRLPSAQVRPRQRTAAKTTQTPLKVSMVCPSSSSARLSMIPVRSCSRKSGDGVTLAVRSDESSCLSRSKNSGATTTRRRVRGQRYVRLPSAESSRRPSSGAPPGVHRDW